MSFAAVMFEISQLDWDLGDRGLGCGKEQFFTFFPGLYCKQPGRIAADI